MLIRKHYLSGGNEMKKAGILTGGGDCPGLNAVIRAVTRKLNNNNVKLLGILDGWKGMLDGNHMELNYSNTDDILPIGGTIIGTSRTNPYKKPEEHVPKIKETFKKLELDCLIAVGGDDTLGVADKLWKNEKLPTIGVPKTIDNDLSATDFTFGFDTAVNAATECIDRLHTTTKSHHRVMIVEAMGRHAGWIAAYAGMAGSADIVLVPEKPIDIEEIINVIERNRNQGKTYNMIVASEGAMFKKDDFVTQDAELDDFGHVKLGGIADQLKSMIEKRTKYEVRTAVLGHIQRGGTPSAFDRILGTRYGFKAAELALEGQFGKMVALSGNKVIAVALSKGVGETKLLDMDFFAVAEEFWKK